MAIVVDSISYSGIGGLPINPKQPVGGSPLFDLFVPGDGVRLRVYNRQELVYSALINDEEMVRLPSGFKSDVWQVEVVGNARLFAIHMAETGKELKNV